MQIEWLPAGSSIGFPPIASALRHPNGLLAAGGDLGPQRLLAAYRRGIFPWFGAGEPILWWSPDPRCIFDSAAIHESRRLARWRRGCDWTVCANTDFAAVIDACAAPRDGESGTWIVPEMRQAYCALHALGHAHSIEVRRADGALVGGLYGVAVGELFCAESMFSRETNASKLALLALGECLAEWGWPWIDAQIASPHLLRMGARTITRAAFLRSATRLAQRDQSPLPFAQGVGQRAVAELRGGGLRG